MQTACLSFLYRHIRHFVITQTKDLENAIEVGDKWLHRLYPIFKYIAFHFKIPPSLETKLYDLTFSSPLTIASFKDDWTVFRIWLDMGMGGGTFKTIMSHPRNGNQKPRIIETNIDGKKGLINAMGLPGKGVSGLIDYLQKQDLTTIKKPIGFSVGGNSTTEYLQNLNRLDAFLAKKNISYYLEINISCPNTPYGQDMIKHPNLLEKLLEDFRRTSQTILGVKLSPDQNNEDLLEFATLIKEIPRTYINIGNTSYIKSTELFIGGGGLSGPALFPRTLEITQLLSPIGVPLIATGGISSAKEVTQLLESGATLVGIATQLVLDPYQIPIINKKLVKHGHLEKRN
ncbi:MAG: hypothetical protein EXS67_01770 [Candidatus Margulisbacteria bacterium]|nr:hypothetical protein [Candidatus Margulisiibacteriota bacterium]